MENGVGIDGGGNLTQQLSAMTIGPSVNGYSNNTNAINGVNKNDGLFQVMKAVEAAEATIKQQVEENHRLRSELQKKIQELENYKSKSNYTNPTNGNQNIVDPMIQVSSASLSPSRYQLEGENAGSPLKQVAIETRDHEQEIMMLRKHLVDYSIKEAQIHNEKFALEKRISYMRLAFDQQQQDLVDAASKALSYRQDIIEENIRLTYALQDAQEERSTFISSLMPLLAEYSLQPPVVDAQSIVSNVKVLFRHLQEKLIGIETKLKESQYQLAAWRSDVNVSSFEQSPLYTFGNQNALELVPQQAYSDGQIPISADQMTTRGWDEPGPSGGIPESSELDAGRYSPLVGRNTPNPTGKNDETSNRQVTFSNPTTPEDPNSYPAQLTPVLEEPGSSFSEAADDDPLPAVESLQISGEAFPGRELQASGYPLNGTTSCNFEWVRHMEDGSVNYIEGAKQPNYLVTADDVDTYLAIEVQPMDNKKRMGELVKVVANEHRKVVCDPEMHDCIRNALQTGHAEYKLSLWTGYLDIWEPVTLIIKKDGINIDGNGTPIHEKFSPSTMVFIPCGNPVEFSIFGLGSVERRLKAEQESAASSSRDVIVLIMRYFIKRAVEKKKVKKKGFFFKT